MKKLLFSLAAVLVTLPIQAQAAPTSFVFSWTNAPANGSIATCSSTVTTNCLVGQTLTDTTANTILTSSLKPTDATYTYTPATFPAPGTRNYSLVINYKDGFGAVQSTAAVTASATIPSTITVNPPTGFSVTLK